MSSNDFKNKREIGLAGKLTKLFLYNRVLAVLSIIIVVIWGILSFIMMPKQYNPEIVAPAFLITTDYPNANSREVYELITRPMEDKISELNKIDGISSQSISGGRSMVMVKFEVGANQEDAKISLNQKLQDNINLKPIGVADPIVKSIDPDDVPIVDIGLTSDIYDEHSLRKMAFDVADEIKRIDGVSKVEIIGGRKNNLNIALDGEQMLARNISVDEISSIIAQSNGIYTADIIRGEDKNTVFNIDGNIENKEDLENLTVKFDNGTPIKIKDIAKVSYGEEEITNYVSLREKSSKSKSVVHIALSKIKGSNATNVATGIEKKLEELDNVFVPDGVDLTVLKNEGETAGDEINKLTLDLAKSIFIVAILLMMFLGFRNAMVATVSIPLILMAVFGAGLIWGETVNRITLFALILALGLLVDDAIVVIENIVRYFRLYPNRDKKEVIIEAVDEVGSALALSTATMALAFIPMAFVTGMMGPYMGPIPFFVPVSLLVSLVLSVTINPFLADLFSGKKINKIESNRNIFLRSFLKLEEKYGKFLNYLLVEKHRYKGMIWGIGGLFLISVFLILTPLVPFRMLPKADRDQFYVYLDFPQGTNIGQNQESSEKVEDILLQQEDIKSVESFMGAAPVVDFNGLFKGSSMRIYEEQATIKVNLVSHKERKNSSEKIAQGFRNDIAQFQKEKPSVDVKVVEDPPGPPVLSTFLLKIKGSDQMIREDLTLDILDKVKNTQGIVDVDTSQSDYSLNYTYKVNIEKAQLLGVTPQSIANNLRVAISGLRVGSYRFSEGESRHPEEEYIILRFEGDDRKSLDILDSLNTPSQQGKMIAIKEVLDISDETFSQSIVSDERQKTTYIYGEMDNRSVVYAVIDLIGDLINYQPKENNLKLVSWSLLDFQYEDILTGEKYFIEIDGEWKLTLEVFRDLGMAMLIAIFMIYFVLATKVKSLNTPLLIMISIPLGLIGVFPGFGILYLVKGTYFNATSMIGIIALSGLSVKNSVIFLEYLDPLVEKGMNLREALVETGKIRLLPIVLTSLTAILGSLTIISDPVWEGLAWSIIFGLTVSTFLTLIVFPIIYYIAKNK